MHGMEEVMRDAPPVCKYCRGEMEHVSNGAVHLYRCVNCGACSPPGETQAQAYAKATVKPPKRRDYNVNWGDEQ